MEQKYLLAICIPTYNRKHTLERLINSIISQKSFSEEISIVINDGPSTDGTEDYILNIQKHYSNIFYKRNPLAVWMLPAILESIEMSNWAYTWLFWSDDFLYENALEIILNILKKQSPTILLSNRVTFNKIDDCIQNSLETQVRIFHGFNDFWSYLWLSSLDSFEDKHNYFTFMSVFCFRTNYFHEAYNFTIDSICTRESLERHYFNYILILYSQLFISEKIALIINPRLVFCQSDNHNWKHNSKITKDIKMLCDFIKIHYTLSSSTSTLLNKFVFRWWFVCNIVSPINGILKKIWLYEILSRIWRKLILKK